jgi:hypothetical protein
MKAPVASASSFIEPMKALLVRELPTGNLRISASSLGARGRGKAKSRDPEKMREAGRLGGRPKKKGRQQKSAGHKQLGLMARTIGLSPHTSLESYNLGTISG